jgi:hypothetical protein
MIRLTCTWCGREIRGNDGKTASLIHCPICGEAIVVPGASDLPAPTTAVEKWFILLGHEELGPVSFHELRILAQRGAINPETPVSTDTSFWRDASSVDGLCFRSAPPNKSAIKPPESQKRSRASVRREISHLRQIILEYVLDDPADLHKIPPLDAFTRERSQLVSEIQAAKRRVDSLEEAREQYILLHDRRKAANADYEVAKTDLAKFYRPLGAFAFAAFQTGELSRHDELANRIALEERIEFLRQEHNSLTLRLGSGILETAKAKAQQLAVAAKIKIEEFRIQACDKAAGKRIAEKGELGAFNCPRTASLIADIAAAKAVLTDACQDLQTARHELRDTAEEFIQALALERIDGVSTFNRVISLVNAAIEAKQRQIDRLTEGLPEQLASEVAAFRGTPVYSYLMRLAGGTKTLRSAERPGGRDRFFDALHSLPASTFDFARSRKYVLVALVTVGFLALIWKWPIPVVERFPGESARIPLLPTQSQGNRTEFDGAKQQSASAPIQGLLGEAEAKASHLEPQGIIPGLARMGYSTSRCLICDGARSHDAILKYSDRRQYGLCEQCGQSYEGWKLVLKKHQAQISPSETDLRVAKVFSTTLDDYYNRYDDDARRLAARPILSMGFLSGQFGSKEWDALIGSLTNSEP